MFWLTWLLRPGIDQQTHLKSLLQSRLVVVDRRTRLVSVSNTQLYHFSSHLLIDPTTSVQSL